MKTIKFFVLLITITTLFASCTKDDSPENGTDLADIEITTTATSSSVKLSWKPVEGCSWYKIYLAVAGATLEEKVSYQDLDNDPITYTLSGLTANTTYDVKINGTDYAVGGKLIATKTLSVKTNP